MNFGDMKKQGWALTSESQMITEDDELTTSTVQHHNQSNDRFDDDDDDDVQLGNNSFYNHKTITSNYDQNDYDDDEPTLKSGKTFKTERQTMMERKKLEADARAQELT